MQPAHGNRARMPEVLRSEQVALIMSRAPRKQGLQRQSGGVATFRPSRHRSQKCSCCLRMWAFSSLRLEKCGACPVAGSDRLWWV